MAIVEDGKEQRVWSADTPVRMSFASTGTAVDDPKFLIRNNCFAGGTGDADKSVRAPINYPLSAFAFCSNGRIMPLLKIFYQ